MTGELEKLLDAFKRYSQQAGIAQQKAAEEGSRDDTRMWLDKAEAKRAEILALHRHCARHEIVNPLNDEVLECSAGTLIAELRTQIGASRP